MLGVSASPRVGATDFMVKAALAYARERYPVETDHFSVHHKNIRFCIHCDYCIRKKQGCVHRDDMAELYPKLIWADAWLLATPIYQGQLSGQLKTIMDRCRAVVAGNPKVFNNKVGAAMAVGGDRSGGQEPAMQAIHDFYIIHNMLPVSGGSFGANLGIAVWSKDQKAEGAQQDDQGLRAMRKTVKRLIEVTQLVWLPRQE